MPKRRQPRITRDIVQRDQDVLIADVGSRSITVRLVAMVRSAVVIAAVVTAKPWLAAVIAIVVFTVLYGIALPAAWTKNPAHHRQGMAVLEELRR